ncbi:MAG: HEPN domain-containing protein [Candidatus Moranbacteria bacterium]|nr:HEPN domain-containing protein [Candidatus Moranbacteria bacterium]
MAVVIQRNMDLSKTAEYFKESAGRDWKSAKVLFKSKRYDSALFFCHLTLEKSLKYLVISKTNKQPPYTHRLLKLVSLAGLFASKEQSEHLKEVNTFNIAGRYDDHKLAFYKSCTKEFAEKYLKITDKLFLWIKKNYPKE